MLYAYSTHTMPLREGKKLSTRKLLRGPNILLSPLFLGTLNLRHSINVRNEVHVAVQ
jgi:hypothetical protein